MTTGRLIHKLLTDRSVKGTERCLESSLRGPRLPDPVEHYGSSEVLVIENDPTTCTRIDLLLKGMGLSCLTIGSAAQAHATVRSTYFPLVVIDNILPDGDGIQLCSRTRGAGKCRRSYIVLLSSVNSDAELARALAAGADDYISKTASDAQIVECLKAASRYARLSRGSRAPDPT